jgi:alkanesulfonate monooxygenase SsuD/methylene tetrahydromethanopterin reductase-like flavin-dependent oxidoreductase (luciferase family)
MSAGGRGATDRAVKFGFTLAAAPTSTSRDGRFEPIYDLCSRAEELGYDFVTVPHHRFSPEQADPSPR